MRVDLVDPATIEYVCDTNPLPMIGDELQRKGATVADDPCIECGGTTYELHNEIVCGRCSLVIDGADDTESPSDWEYFWNNRPTYSNGTIRCVGGFPHVHDWVTSDEIAGTVGTLDPETFYR